MIYKINAMFWDENERTGYRHVSVEYNDRILMAVTACRSSNEWQSQVIPMGFSFQHNEIQAFSELFSVLPGLMTFLSAPSLTFEEVEQYLLTLQ